MEVSEVRQRLQRAIEEAGRRSAHRRARNDEAARAWDERVASTVVPAFTKLQQALAGENHRFKMSTPAGSARLARDRSAEEFVEMVLDTDRDVPAVLLRSVRGRGRRMVSTERIVREGDAIASLSEDDVVAVVADELVGFIER
jgi:hypothetical protein